MEWTRIPSPIDTDADRRELAAILSAYGFEVRIVRERATKNGSYKRYIEYRPQT